MSSGDKADAPKVKRSCINKPKVSPEEVVAGFNGLRNEQRQIANKIYELDSDLNEHRYVNSQNLIIISSFKF